MGAQCKRDCYVTQYQTDKPLLERFEALIANLFDRLDEFWQHTMCSLKSLCILYRIKYAAIARKKQEQGFNFIRLEAVGWLSL